MEELIRISNINDFLFCPVSIYFHGLMDGADRTMVQSEYQINGTAAHRSVDDGTYSSRREMLLGVDVCSIKYGVTGRIDQFDVSTGMLTERKRHVSKIHPGYVMQLYGQYFGMVEAGYEVKSLRIHSMDDNRNYPIPHPDESPEMVAEFEKVLDEMHSFDISGFMQTNGAKCRHCIYEPMCANSGSYDDETRFREEADCVRIHMRRREGIVQE